MKLMLACLGLLMSIPLKLAAQEVATDHSSTFDFSRLQAFAVKVGTPWGEPSSEAAARQAIAKRLVKRGWKETDESSCDALVVLHGARPGKQTFRALYSDWLGYGWHNVGAPALADTTDYDYKPGTLVVDIFDAKTKQVVFRGVAKGLTAKPASGNAKFDKAAKKMLEDLPSGKSGASGESTNPPF